MGVHWAEEQLPLSVGLGDLRRSLPNPFDSVILWLLSVQLLDCSCWVWKRLSD